MSDGDTAGIPLAVGLPLAGVGVAPFSCCARRARAGLGELPWPERGEETDPLDVAVGRLGDLVGVEGLSTATSAIAVGVGQ